MVAAVGYCVWPAISEMTSVPETKPPANVPEIAGAAISPQPSEPFVRNPFLSRDEQQLTESENDYRPGHGTPGKPGVPRKDVDPLSGLKLSGTCIAGNASLAIINGNIYGVKDTIKTSDGGQTPVTVAEVLPYKVVLECEGKTFELAYADARAPDLSAAAPAAQASNRQSKTSLTKKSPAEVFRGSNRGTSGP
jgi:hypothetical protein